jgi:outer membrane receptor protein involved in Fe transport
MDGVRLNQPFGDVVSWDLIPRAAIASVSLMPGSNPLFGLNTLGGALSIQTKDGRSAPGGSLQGYLGENSRRAAEFEYGGFSQALDWYLTGNLFREHGWREDSPSRVGQIFGKLGWHDAASDLRMTLAYADTNLNGSGLQEQRFLPRDYASLYTKPDITENRSTFLNLVGNHAVSDGLSLTGNAYYRRIRTSTLNGDLNDDSLDQAVYQPNAAEQAALRAAGYSGFPTAGENASNAPFPFWRCIANVLRRDEPAEKCNGLVNRSSTKQENWGVSGQFTLSGDLAGNRNQLTAGAAWDEGRVRFAQSSELGYLNPDRSITGLNAFADGVTGGVVDGEPFDTRVDLASRVRTWSVYATDTLTFAQVWHLTLSGRYNRTTIDNTDRVNPGGGAGSLDGRHAYERLNPAVGLTFAPGKAAVAYVGYSEGSRAPTAIELGCADPGNPCRLPNSMAGDPPLKQVVTKTWEAGLHGALSGGLRWNAGVFRAENQDDILFVAAPNQTQFGFFKNFGKDAARGLRRRLERPHRRGHLRNELHVARCDLPVGGDGERCEQQHQRYGGGRHTRTRRQHTGPTWRSHSAHSAAHLQGVRGLSGERGILAGSRFHCGRFELRPRQREQSPPAGRALLPGSGKSNGYGVLNLTAQYRFEPRFSVFGQINNVFDREYYTASLLGPTGFTANGSYIARPLPAVGAEFPVSTRRSTRPGAPRTFWVGLRYELGASR